MERIAYCGLDCTSCPAYGATQSGKRAALETVLIHWREAYDAPHLTLADIACDGCRAGGELNVYCDRCPIRSCAHTRGVANCAFCSDYPCAELEELLSACDGQHGLFGYARRARATLEEIRVALR